MSDLENDRRLQRKSRRIMLLVAGVCIAPFIAAYVVYYFMPPSGRVNYGELVEGVVLPAVALPPAGASDKSVNLAQLRGRWLFVTADASACDDYCQKKLWQIRQVRKTQGQSLQRIERLWLLTDDGPVAPAVEKEYEGTYIARASGNAQGSAVLKALPAETGVRDHIWLVDPLGNVVLRYPRNVDPTFMRKDLERLLKVSRIE